jgi:uncharacterized protein CbrC (UPF0167 family)
MGPVYAEEELGDSLCPWCISDGSAHAKFGASFTDEAGVGGYGEWDHVAETAVAEVAYRTPGFAGWQQERWWTHCGEPAAFVGRAGYLELLAAGPEAIEAIRSSTALADGPQWRAFLSALDKDGSPSAYLFRCVACSALGGYQDCD